MFVEGLGGFDCEYFWKIYTFVFVKKKGQENDREREIATISKTLDPFIRNNSIFFGILYIHHILECLIICLFIPPPLSSKTLNLFVIRDNNEWLAHVSPLNINHVICLPLCAK